MFAALSLAFFVRLIKTQKQRDMWYYSLFALLTMYTHYYGIFLIFSEFCVAFLLYFVAPDRKLYLKRFGGSALVLGVGYIPWLPFLLKVSQNTAQTWYHLAGEGFMYDYFHDYFGYSATVLPIIVLLLLIYLINVFQNGEGKPPTPLGSPLSLSFVVFSVCLVITYAIPYLRSQLKVPILENRYTIEVLPIYLAAAAYGLELIRDRWAKGVVFTVFIGYSLLFLQFTDKTYSEFHKTQFRELTAYLAAQPRQSSYPLVNDVIMSEEEFYLHQYHVSNPKLTEPRGAVVDSILHSTSPKYAVDGFWLIDAEGGTDPAKFLDSAHAAALKTAFFLEKQQTFYQAWAQLYVSKKRFLTTDDFPQASVGDYGGRAVAIWGGSVTSKPALLPEGDYTIRITAKGTPAKRVYPHVTVLVNGQTVGEYTTADDFQDKDFPFRQTGSDSIRVTIRLDNDFQNAHEDRNVFLKKIEFLKNHG